MVHGQILPAYASACGKLLLSFLDTEELEQTIDSTELTAFTPNTITDKGGPSCATWIQFVEFLKCISKRDYIWIIRIEKSYVA
ncbi:MAG: hypothetical protein HFI92_02925 [Lachnospiraceae bacterium]|nr:hypothetical protein [Lachnospiraceae bacterium]